ncbi:hypothetical protein LCGC14_0365830 [marine sediment metagenome]|uniref:Uncharacterized protein n=1 Tax=marine sediment metagenome TaxID=412755 RepID=A0A0F9VU00_9ZZZZ
MILDAMVDMGIFEIQCDKDKVIWSVTERLTSFTIEFESLDDALYWIKREVNSVVIEED